MKKLKEQKGISLLALVITIIVLLILAGVTINMLSGENGILTQARQARQSNADATKEEKLKLAVQAALIDGEGKIDIEDTTGNTKGSLKKQLATAEEFTYTGTDGQVTAGEKIYKVQTNGEIEEIEAIDTSSYVGCYADLEGDGTIDGIIYADLAVGKSGKYFDSVKGVYSYETTSDLKEYYVEEKNHKQTWGTGTTEITADVIAPISGKSGNDRFYVMALEDFSGDQYYWYRNACGNMLDYSTCTSANFGEGKSNTENMITKWNASEYGEQLTSGRYVDLWGVIQTKVSEGWFLPSIGELFAFGDYIKTNLGITSSNYGSIGLSARYFLSSQVDASQVWLVRFDQSNATYSNIYHNQSHVRLSTTF